MMTERITQIILLPNLLKEKDQSIVSLLEKIDFNYSVSEMEIYLALQQYPEIVERWLQYSDDKRVENGWFYNQEKDTYIVGYYDRSKGVTSKNIFLDREKSCAVFIMNELKSISRLR